MPFAIQRPTGGRRPILGPSVPFRYREAQSSGQCSDKNRAKRPERRRTQRRWPRPRGFSGAIDRDFVAGAADPRPPPRRTGGSGGRLWRPRARVGADRNGPRFVAFALNPSTKPAPLRSSLRSKRAFAPVFDRLTATKRSGRAVWHAGLLRGACHRAGHFGPDPLARNHEKTEPRRPFTRRFRLPPDAATCGC